MKTSLTAILLCALLAAPAGAAPGATTAAERAWGPFIAAFRAAVRERDRATLRGMMAAEFFTSGGVGAGREEAFEFWDEPHTRGWEAFAQVLARGTAAKAAWWDRGRKIRYAGRVAPPAANDRRNIKRGRPEWHAVFEFRGGRWVCTAFAQCCD